jgi:hypothetical protein
MLRLSRRRFIAVTVTASCFVQSSCGTILHPERIGQPPGRLDPGVVCLDGVGLLVFLIPGALAFAIDFFTGAIYLPPQYSMKPSAAGAESGEPLTIHIDPRTLTPERVEEVLRAQTGRDVRLHPGAYRVVRIESLDEFSDGIERLAQAEGPQSANAVVFRCQSE